MITVRYSQAAAGCDIACDAGGIRRPFRRRVHLLQLIVLEHCVCHDRISYRTFRETVRIQDSTQVWETEQLLEFYFYVATYNFESVACIGEVIYSLESEL